MVDVSDGLALDLHRLADASGVGLVLWDVPVAPGATPAEALGGGEDYELVMATGDVARLRAGFDRAGLPEPLVVGRVVADHGHRTWQGEPLPRAGYEHGRGQGPR
jgi:thiamine-monophosphate kinase